MLIAGTALGAASTPVPAPTVRAGIEAWQKGDYKAAVEMWRTLADRGDRDAQFNLAQAYRLGRGVPANSATSKSLFERAARSGHLESQTTLGLLLVQSGDRIEGLGWLKSAAESGEPRALLVYGTALFNGDGVTQDQRLGYSYVYSAAATGLATAKRTLAELDKLLPAAERKKALSRPTTVAVPKPQKQKPAAKPAPIAANGQWRIQLGAFARPGAAQALFAKLAGSLAGGRPYYLPTGKVIRLQAGPYPTRIAAASACAALKLRGQDCVVVESR